MNNTYYAICFILKKGGEKEGKKEEAKILLIFRHPNKR